MNTYPTFTKGQKVRTCWGEVKTVASQNGCKVFMIEDCTGWYHPTKIFAI